MLYTVTITKANGDTLMQYHDQDLADANFIIANSLKEGYPVPEFNGIAQELNEYMDIIIEEQDDEPCDGCGYDMVLDQRHSNTY
jgi:hypothetical protein